MKVPSKSNPTIVPAASDNDEHHVVPPFQRKERPLAPLQTYYATLKFEHVHLVALQDQRKLQHGKAKKLLLALQVEVQERQLTNARLEQQCLLQRTEKNYSDAQQHLEELQQSLNVQDKRQQQLIQAIQKEYFQYNHTDHDDDDHDDDHYTKVEQVTRKVQQLEEQLREMQHTVDSNDITGETRKIQLYLDTKHDTTLI